MKMFCKSKSTAVASGFITTYNVLHITVVLPSRIDGDNCEITLAIDKNASEFTINVAFQYLNNNSDRDVFVQIVAENESEKTALQQPVYEYRKDFQWSGLFLSPDVFEQERQKIISASSIGES